MIRMIRMNEVLHYLGFDSSKPDSQTLKELKEISEEMESVVKGRWVYDVYAIHEVQETLVTFKDSSIQLEGKSISKHLKSCTRAYILACTLGPQADRMIGLNGFLSPTLGMLTDACASSLVEAYCDKCQEEIAKELSFEETLTVRFSPGYGDLPLKNQKEILEELKAEKRIGLFLTDSLLMTPRKSVVAILGVLHVDALRENNHRCGNKDCSACTLREKCNFKIAEHYKA
jgi:hypothetical protein